MVTTVGVTPLTGCLAAASPIAVLAATAAAGFGKRSTAFTIASRPASWPAASAGICRAEANPLIIPAWPAAVATPSGPSCCKASAEFNT